MREIEHALASIAEMIRGEGSVPEDVLIALDQLRSSVGRWLSTTGPTLYVPEHGRWFVSPAGRHVDLSRRPTMRGIVDALVTARVERPGETLASSTLIAAGWPSEPEVSEASANRLRVTLCRLRQLGLEPALVTTSAGWMLDPALPLVRETTSQDMGGREADRTAAVTARPPPMAPMAPMRGGEDGSGIYVADEDGSIRTATEPSACG